MDNTKSNLTTFTFQLDKALLEKLQENRRVNLIPVGAYIRRAIEEKIAREKEK